MLSQFFNLLIIFLLFAANYFLYLIFEYKAQEQSVFHKSSIINLQFHAHF